MQTPIVHLNKYNFICSNKMHRFLKFFEWTIILLESAISKTFKNCFILFKREIMVFSGALSWGWSHLIVYFLIDVRDVLWFIGSKKNSIKKSCDENVIFETRRTGIVSLRSVVCNKKKFNGP